MKQNNKPRGMPFDTDKLGLIEGLFDNFQNLGRKKTTTPSRDEQTKKKTCRICQRDQTVTLSIFDA